ncbi:hypothetical protein EON66_00270 [archaeon]|nr:MAG: hypothetical protein EON66_00270 [archaeon]
MLHRKKATEAAKAAAAAAAGADAVSIDGSAVSGSDAGTPPATPSTVDAGAGAANKPKISLLGGMLYASKRVWARMCSWAGANEHVRDARPFPACRSRRARCCRRRGCPGYKAYEGF